MACWHQAFAALPPEASQSLSLHFTRAPGRDIIEHVRIPVVDDPYVKQLTTLYLAALGNNVLCTLGARRLTLFAGEGGIADTLVPDLRRLLCDHASLLTSRPMDFPLSLMEAIYHEPFSVVSTDSPETPSPRSGTATPQPRCNGPVSILAVNIGQHLTSVALVHFNANGSYGLLRFHRQKTWSTPNAGFGDIWQQALAALAMAATNPPVPIGAVAISLAATVVAGNVIPVSEAGLFAASSPEELPTVNETMRHDLGSAFPGLPVTFVNDAEAQALFAFATCDREAEQEDECFLSLRLGACPCVRPLDAHGWPASGIHEYGWLAIRRNPHPMLPGVFTTVTPYLTHYGIGHIARELTLLEKYGLDGEQAISFFHDKLQNGNSVERREARAVYHVLGAHIAMLAMEVHRRRPLSTIALHGSRTNAIDAPAFAAISNGFYHFCDRHHLPLIQTGLVCLEDSSAQAGVVGAALAGLRC